MTRDKNSDHASTPETAHECGKVLPGLGDEGRTVGRVVFEKAAAPVGGAPINITVNGSVLDPESAVLLRRLRDPRETLDVESVGVKVAGGSAKPSRRRRATERRVRFYPQYSESGPLREIVWAPEAREARFLKDLQMRRWFAEHGPRALAADPDLAALVELAGLPIVRREIEFDDVPLGLRVAQDLLELLHPIFVKLDRDASRVQVQAHESSSCRDERGCNRSSSTDVGATTPATANGMRGNRRTGVSFLRSVLPVRVAARISWAATRATRRAQKTGA